MFLSIKQRCFLSETQVNASFQFFRLIISRNHFLEGDFIFQWKSHVVLQLGATSFSIEGATRWRSSVLIWGQGVGVKKTKKPTKMNTEVLLLTAEICIGVATNR